MPKLNRSALLTCSAEQMYAVITDVAAYPEFLPWCTAASVEQRVAAPELGPRGETMVASLRLSAKGLKEQFTTRNHCLPPSRVQLDLVSGPFRAFTGQWDITAIGDAGCRTELMVDFELKGGLGMLGRVLAGSLSSAADRILEAFCQRAEAKR